MRVPLLAVAPGGHRPAGGKGRVGGGGSSPAGRTPSSTGGDAALPPLVAAAVAGTVDGVAAALAAATAVSGGGGGDDGGGSGTGGSVRLPPMGTQPKAVVAVAAAAGPPHGAAALLAAATHGHAPVVEALLAAGVPAAGAPPGGDGGADGGDGIRGGDGGGEVPADGWDAPLHVAARRGHARTVALLLAAGAPINARGATGATPLGAAAAAADTGAGAGFSAPDGQEAVVAALLAAGAAVDVASHGGVLPIHAAAAGGHAALVASLLAAGADGNAVLRRRRREAGVGGGGAGVLRALRWGVGGKGGVIGGEDDRPVTLLTTTVPDGEGETRSSAAAVAASTSGAVTVAGAAEGVTDVLDSGVVSADGGASSPAVEPEEEGEGAAEPRGSDGSDGSDLERRAFRLTRNAARVALEADIGTAPLAAVGAAVPTETDVTDRCDGSPTLSAANGDAVGACDGEARDGGTTVPLSHPSRMRGLFRRRSAPAPGATTDADADADSDASCGGEGAAVPFFCTPGGPLSPAAPSPPAGTAVLTPGEARPPRTGGGPGISAPDLGHLALAATTDRMSAGVSPSADTPSPTNLAERPASATGGIARAVLGRLGGGGRARPGATTAAAGVSPADADAPAAAADGATITPPSGGAAAIRLPGTVPPVAVGESPAAPTPANSGGDVADAAGATTTSAVAVGGIARLVFGRRGGATGGDSAGHAVAPSHFAQSEITEVEVAAAATDEEEGATPLSLAVANGHPDTVRVLVGWGATPGSRWRKGSAAALARRRRDGGMMMALLAGREPSSSSAGRLGLADNDAANGPAGCDGDDTGRCQKDDPTTELRAAYRGFLDDPDSLTLVAVEAELLSPGRVRCFASLLVAHAILVLAADAGVVATTHADPTVAAAADDVIGVPDAVGAAQRDAWFAAVYHEPFDALAPDEVALGISLVRDAASRGLLERHHVAVLYSAYRIAASVRSAVGDLYARLDASTAAANDSAAALEADLAALRAALRVRDRRALAAGVAKVGLCLLPFVGGAVAAGLEVALAATPLWADIGAAATAFLVNHGELGAAAEVLGALSSAGGIGGGRPPVGVDSRDDAVAGALGGVGTLADAAATAEAVADRWGSWAELAMELVDVASAVKEVRSALDADDRGAARTDKAPLVVNGGVTGDGRAAASAPPTGDAMGGGTAGSGADGGGSGTGGGDGARASRPLPPPPSVGVVIPLEAATPADVASALTAFIAIAAAGGGTDGSSGSIGGGATGAAIAAAAAEQQVCGRAVAWDEDPSGLAAALVDGVVPADAPPPLPLLSMPTHLTRPALPADLATAWLVRPRPDGKRGLLVAAGGRVGVRGRNGRPLLPSWGDPAGSVFVGGRPAATTVLEVAVSRDGGVWVVDGLVWGGVRLDGVPAETRLFFLAGRVAEAGGGVGERLGGGCGGRPWGVLPAWDADGGGIRRAYRVACGEEDLVEGRLNGAEEGWEAGPPATAAVATLAKWDGLLFMAKAGGYDVGSTPLVMAWKDARCSEWPVETFPEPPPPGLPVVDWPLVAVLRVVAAAGERLQAPPGEARPSTAETTVVSAAGRGEPVGRMEEEEEERMDVGDGDSGETSWRLETADEPPVSWPLDGATVEGALADGGLDVGGRPATTGDLLRLAVVNVGEVAEEVEEAAAVRTIRFAPVGLASQSRAGADCWSRILFQCHARYAPLTADAIVAAADVSEGYAASDGEGAMAFVTTADGWVETLG